MGLLKRAGGEQHKLRVKQNLLPFVVRHEVEVNLMRIELCVGVEREGGSPPFGSSAKHFKCLIYVW